MVGKSGLPCKIPLTWTIHVKIPLTWTIPGLRQLTILCRKNSSGAALVEAVHRWLFLNTMCQTQDNVQPLQPLVPLPEPSRSLILGSPFL